MDEARAELIIPFDGGRYLLLMGQPVTGALSVEPFFRAILAKWKGFAFVCQRLLRDRVQYRGS